MLKNPFYYGLFRNKGELYQGNHEPIIAKQLFDSVQQIMKQRSKPRKAKQLLSFAFRGVFTCGECGRAITAEKKIKKSRRTYTYYRCTRKNRICSQKYIEERELVEQINELFQKVALSDELTKGFLSRWEQDYKKASTTSSSSAQNLKGELKQIEEKQQRLLDVYLHLYLDRTITNEEYTATKNKLMNRKVELKELADFGRKDIRWLELFKEWILSAHQAINYIDSGNVEEKPSFLQKIGSNFHIAGQKMACTLANPWSAAAKFSRRSVWSG